MTTSFDRDLAQRSAARLKDKRRELSNLVIPPGRGWQPLHEDMGELLQETPVGIGQVITKLGAAQSILDRLPPSQAANRVSAFNELYLTITKRVDGALVGSVDSPEFLELLDVEFAKRYFAALDLWNRDEEDTPDVWEVLFKRAGDVRMSRLVAAMLGVNAHINHDLSLALIATWNETGPPTDDRIHPDYLLINQIFYEEIPPLRRGFSTRWQLELDEFVGPLDDWSQRVLVTVTRARAWDQARRLWDLRHDQDDFEQARRTMDRAASLLGEWVIVADRVVTETGDNLTDGWHLLQTLFRRDDPPVTRG
ncbi:DUF5995 family protein [Micromonosporaceae bacterium Da 78-11]